MQNPSNASASNANANKSRRGWEKEKPQSVPPAGAGRGSGTGAKTTPSYSVNKYIDGLNAEDKAVHRMNFLQILQGACGSDVEVVSTKSAATLTGVLHTATPFEELKNEYILKAVRSSDKDPSILENTLVIDGDAVVSLKTNKIDHLIKKSHSSSEFMTDSSIRTREDIARLDGRKLESIADSWIQADSTNDFGNMNKSSNWDQFEVNKVKFGVKSTFDENLYTKKLDYSTMTAKQRADAERWAREIESTVSSNIHLREERGQIQQQDDDIDEEDRYSGVIRSEADHQHITNNIKLPPNSGKSSSSLLPDDNPWKRGLKLTPSPSANNTSSSTNNVRQRQPSANSPPPLTTAPRKTSAPVSAPVVENSKPIPPLEPVEPVAEKKDESVPAEEKPMVVFEDNPSNSEENSKRENENNNNNENNDNSVSKTSKPLNVTAKEFKPNPNAPVFTPPSKLSNLPLQPIMQTQSPGRGYPAPTVPGYPPQPFLPPEQQVPMYGMYDPMNPQTYMNPALPPNYYPENYMMGNMGMPPVDYNMQQQYMMQGPGMQGQYVPQMMHQDPYINSQMMMQQGLYPNQMMGYPNQMMPNNMGLPYNPQMKGGGEYRHHSDRNKDNRNGDKRINRNNNRFNNNNNNNTPNRSGNPNGPQTTSPIDGNGNQPIENNGNDNNSDNNNNNNDNNENNNES